MGISYEWGMEDSQKKLSKEEPMVQDQEEDHQKMDQSPGIKP